MKTIQTVFLLLLLMLAISSCGFSKGNHYDSAELDPGHYDSMLVDPDFGSGAVLYFH